MRFAVIGDLHLTENRQSLTYKKILPEALLLAEKKKACALIGTGDLTASGTEQQTFLLLEALKRSPLPFYSTPGNAETRSNTLHAIQAQNIPAPENIPVIFVDSSTSKVKEEDIASLAALPENSHFLLCSHYPPEMWENEALEILEEAKKRKAVTGIICGHVHKDGVHTMRGLDPDKASGNPPAVVFMEQDEEGFWKRSEEILNDMDPKKWTKEEKRIFLAHLGVSCMQEPLETLEEAARLSIPVAELRYEALDNMSDTLLLAVKKWRNAGGRLLSLHLPNLRPYENSMDCDLAKGVQYALILGCDRVTLHVPEVTASEFPDKKKALTENFVKLLTPLMEKNIVIAIENLHTKYQKWDDSQRNYGCTINECASWIEHLKNVTKYADIGFHCDIGHARNNVPFSIHEYMSDYYASDRLPFKGFHFHQIVKIEENHFKNHFPLTGFYDKVIALSGYFLARKNALLPQDAPVILEINTPGGSVQCYKKFLELIGS
ncbi:MAG: metallophosphoesterase [Lentisphaeria bacterium]|nr:metallophosphoesterase [Lentisphaeria bacterium]